MKGGKVIHIWIIDHYAIHPRVPGITRHYSLAKELKKRNYEVTIVASNFQHRIGKANANIGNDSYKEETVDGIRFLWIDTPAYGGNNVRRFYNMVIFGVRARHNKKLAASANKPDLIIGLSPNPFAALSAERLAAFHGVPFILEIRDLWPATLLELGNFSKYHPIIIMLGLIEKYLVKKAHKIVTVLPGAINYFKKLGVQEEKVVVIPNGIDTDLLPAYTVETVKKPFVITYAGAHGLANDLETIIYCAKELNDDGYNEYVLFKFIGEGPEKDKLINLAQALGVENIVFEDPVPKFSVYEKLAEADAYIAVLKKCNLYKWGISLTKLFDYMAMGKPVLLAAEAFNDPVKEAKAGITVPPENPQALADAIKAMLGTDELQLRKMGMNGRDYVLQNHSYQGLSLQLEEVILDALDKSAEKKVK